MKRDMDLIRAMLLQVEAHPHGRAPDKIEIAGYTEEQINFHAFLLVEAGLAEGFEVTNSCSNSPEAIINRLTWTGYEFLDSARNDGIWNKAKTTIINKLGGASFVVLTALLTAFTKEQVGLK